MESKVRIGRLLICKYNSNQMNHVYFSGLSDGAKRVSGKPVAPAKSAIRYKTKRR